MISSICCLIFWEWCRTLSCYLSLPVVWVGPTTSAEADTAPNIVSVLCSKYGQSKTYSMPQTAHEHREGFCKHKILAVRWNFMVKLHYFQQGKTFIALSKLKSTFTWGNCVWILSGPLAELKQSNEAAASQNQQLDVTFLHLLACNWPFVVSSPSREGPSFKALSRAPCLSREHPVCFAGCWWRDHSSSPCQHRARNPVGFWPSAHLGVGILGRAAAVSFQDI